MDYQEALEVLGLEAGASATLDRLRRTYLKLVSKYPPEKDPEGFKRLREAFEVVRARISTPTLAPPVPSTSSAPVPSTSPAPLPNVSIGERDPRTAAREREQLIDVINGLIQSGDIRGAIEVERKWRESLDNDVALDNPATLLRWVQTRELLAVAGHIDPSVLRALGAGVLIGHPEIAFPFIDDVRARSWGATDRLFKALAKDAPTIYNHLGRPRYPRPASIFVRRYWPGVMVGMISVVFVIFAIVTGPKHPPERGPENKTVAPPPRALDGSASTADLAAEIASSLDVLDSPEFGSSEQRDAASSLERYMRREDCRGVRVYTDHLQRAKPSANRDAREAAASHIAAIRERVDVLCPTIDSPWR